MSQQLTTEQLTEKLCAACAGQSVKDMIGAGFNVIQTALNAAPDKRLLSAVAATLRHQADMLDKMAGSDRH